eukprot:443378_1
MFLLVYQMFVSKWNTFSYYMIASKHDSFVLTQPIEEFVKQCDDLFSNVTDISKHYELKSRELSDPRHLVETQLLKDYVEYKQNPREFKRKPVVHQEQTSDDKALWLWIIKFLFRQQTQEQNEHSLFQTIYGPIAVSTNSILILGISFAAHTIGKNDDCINNTADIILAYNLITICIILLICLGWITRRSCQCFIHNSTYNTLSSAIIFSLCSSQIFACCYMVYFYGLQLCNNHDLWELLLLLEISGFLTCFTPWC